MSFSFQGQTNSPSTPNRKYNRSQGTHPSTTPAGPPPSYLSQYTNASTTPAGPPPRSVYGSSFNAANNTFGTRGPTPRRPRGFTVPESSPPLADDNDDEDAQGDDDDEIVELRGRGRRQVDQSMFMSSVMSSPRGLKRSRNGAPRQQVASDYSAIARSISGSSAPANLEEPDDVVLQQEDVVSRMDKLAEAPASTRSTGITEHATEMARLWQQHGETTTREGALGPDAHDAFSKAAYLAALLLQLHHPHSARISQSTQLSHVTAAARRGRNSRYSIPYALIDWLEIYHNPFPDDFDAIWRTQPSATAHERFWDTIFACLVRGKFDRASKLLKEAQWEHAETAAQDLSRDDATYSDKQLESIETVIEHCVVLLQTSPISKDDDWDVKGGNWAAFRQRVRQTVKHLETFAGEDDGEDDVAGFQQNVFESSAMGRSMGITAASRKAESKVPWSIYENLKLAYGILLGHDTEIVDVSQDWLEASIYLTAWWDGTDAAAVDLSKSQSLHKSIRPSQRSREVDVTPVAAYQNRLATAFLAVTESDDALFTPQTMDPLQVGLACVMLGSVESAIGLLRLWSLPVTNAVVEVAALAGWLPRAKPRSMDLLEQGFSSEDLMVLSHGPGQNAPPLGEVERDEILIEYADLLAEKPLLKTGDGTWEQEGWELAIAVFGRLDNHTTSEEKISMLLAQIELTDEARVERVLAACSAQGLTEQARTIAERYADTLAESTQAYGSALLFYARAHAAEKLKSTLALLNSLCLLHSAALPATQDLDAQLASLLRGSRRALVDLARADPEAAEMLASALSGYATLRRFYHLRDQEVNAADESKPSYRPLERKREAATALIAVAESAADCIQGGLYDPAVESVVPVDGVLTLLGEALPLLNQPKRIFSKAQTFTLLRLVEDFATAPLRIRQNADGLLQASISAYRDSSKTTMSGMLKKSRSNMSKEPGLGGSSYDMLASSFMDQSQDGKDSEVGNVKRAWDWRKGLDALGGSGAGQDEVLVMLRVALAQEVARGWSGAINW